MLRRVYGFTLMEMVAALTVLAVLAAVGVPYLSNGVRAYNDTTSALNTLGNLRVASERLVREIREIRRNPLAPGNYDTTINANPLIFTKTDGETVTVNSAAPLLTLAYASLSGATPYTLSDELQSISFRYLQADGTPATGSDNVAFIEFELVLNHAGNDYPQRSRVALRNQP